MQTIDSSCELLAFNHHRIAKFDRGVFIRSSAPHLTIGHKLAPDLTIVHQRSAVVDGDIRNANALRDQRMLAGAREVQDTCAVSLRRWTQKCRDL